MVLDADAPPLEPRWPVDRPSEPPSGEVHLWLADLDRPPLAREHLASLLSPDERARAERFRFDVHRARFTAGRGLLRTLLGRYLDADPAALAFEYGSKGKPRLAQPARDLRFNLSNSRNAVLIAVSRGAELGADIEALSELRDAAALVERFFHPAERQVFARLAPAERLAGFYSGWTRKEAYVKARGDGLSLPTSSFQVDLAPGGPAALVRFDQEPEEVARWTLTALEPARGYLGALAVEALERGGQELRCHVWREEPQG